VSRLVFVGLLIIIGALLVVFLNQYGIRVMA
jgi:hypothetical protein